MNFPRLVIKRPVRSLRDIEPMPKWIEQLPLYLGWGVIWLATIVGTYGFRAMQDFNFAVHAVELADQGKRDVAAADSLVAGCLSIETGQRLLEVSEDAAALLARRQLLQSWVLHLATPRVQYVTQVDD